MIYIEIRENNEIGSRHFQPFDEKNGLGRTIEELQQSGVLVESIPEPENLVGKTALLRYNGENLYYEYIDRPLTTEEKLEMLEKENADLWYALIMKGVI